MDTQWNSPFTFMGQNEIRDVTKVKNERSQAFEDIEPDRRVCNARENPLP